ncbi:hypothetical protein BABINDRAFT_161427 [Babjeviella inositovora NRRL Y-12698]|uniref:U three protein 7 n=1 Tax=Babjeviella inositovora NRRL Y-12698 TaxID=984486 RepID=A0A1E3QPT2_9ASCO|nr:uncharacterized protein BABINDRAFT_161427 [Babjeviella inositovora NRRL Y-12698]ODQ79716.1 hypothetical protein BABINDRAFT_161427 [Babjeviella inositovora NRRL Y-12698]
MAKTTYAGKMGSTDRANTRKFERAGEKGANNRTNDKKLKAGLKKIDNQYKQALNSAAGTDLLLQENEGLLEAEGMEKTYKFQQQDIVEAVDIGTANKSFELKLNEFGPYTLDYTRNGRELLIAGKKGHVASIDWRTGKLDCELHLGETVHAIKYLHNDQYFAAAQKKYTFIYDKTGTELHRLKQHIEATILEFLPYHYLLATAGNTGYLKYHDVSTGVLVAELRTKLGPTISMKQNPWNAVVHLGHSNGTVTLWAPNMSTPLAKLQTARGPVRAMAIDREGRYMATAGADKTIKLWDIRTFKELDQYYSPTPASTLDISDTGLLSVGWGPHVSVWKDTFKTKQNSPYMTHLLPGSLVTTTKFVPFEDILGIGHAGGISSIIVPGSGEANFDALELNPYETAKQRQQGEVRSLLNKLSPDMITIDPTVIGTVDKRASQVRLKPSELAAVTKDSDEEVKMEIQPTVRGKNSSLRRHLRKKKQNVVDVRKMKIETNLKREKELRAQKHRHTKGEPEEKNFLGPALSRFK